MNYRKIGSSDLEVSEIGMGTWALGGPVTYMGHSVGWRKIEDHQAIATLFACADVGVNFLDTADIYGQGRAEILIGKALREMGSAGKDMIVATKVGFDLAGHKPIGENQNFSRDYIFKSCDLSLKRLRREVIDLYQLHCVPLSVLQKGEAANSLNDLKKEGKIREWGVSIVTTEEALASLEIPGNRCIQIIFNLFRQKPIQTVFPKAKEKGVGILARVPLASGLLTGKFKPDHQFDKGDHRREGIPGETFSGLKFRSGLKAVEELRALEHAGERNLTQTALSFTLQYDAVSSTIPGATRPEQIRENASASSLPAFSQDEFDLCQRIYKKFCKSKMEELF
jgi:aryl-alcohol dehydrogenase-like predicted oxidoreductase